MHESAEKYQDVARTQIGSGMSMGMNAAKRVPPLELALDHLSQTVEGLAQDAAALRGRLEAVSQPVPKSASETSSIRTGSACYYQNRLDELRERIGEVAAGLRDAREMLCI